MHEVEGSLGKAGRGVGLTNSLQHRIDEISWGCHLLGLCVVDSDIEGLLDLHQDFHSVKAHGSLESVGGKLGFADTLSGILTQGLQAGQRLA